MCTISTILCLSWYESIMLTYSKERWSLEEFSQEVHCLIQI
jgi:hypothetical protein